MVGWRLRLFWALLLGTVAAVAMYMYLKSVDPTVGVVVAKVTIPARTAIAAEMLTEKTVSRRDLAALVPNPVSRVDQVVGAVAVREIPAGQPLTDAPEFLRRGEAPTPPEGVHLSDFLPDGSRAVTLALDEAGVVGGSINENDRVDVVFTSRDNATGGVYSATLVQGATVLKISKPASGQSLQYQVTLLVTPQQAMALALGKHQGFIDLSLSPPNATPLDLPAFSPLQIVPPTDVKR